MAFRTIEVKLAADTSGFMAGMGAASASVKGFHGEVMGAAREGNKALDMLGKGLLVAGAAGAAGLAKATAVGMDFQKTMSGVRAVSGATADEMKRLEKAALDAGSSTQLAGVTASDAAAAQSELLRAGVSTSEVLGGALMGSLTLASAGQLEFADAATIAAQAMNIFDLSGSDVSRVADTLAAAANKSAAGVGDLGDALRQGGLVAAQTGLSIEETVAALAAFADNALVGSDAGTSLKTMLQRLTPQSTEAAGLMDQLGFSAYDLQGSFIGLEGLAGDLQESLGGLNVEQRNSAMSTLFGSDAVRGANVLFELGAEGVRDYTDAVVDQGAASRMAAELNNNLSGDIEALGGAIETVLIQGAGSADGVMRTLTQTLTTMVTGVSELQGPLGGAATGLGMVTTAAALVGGATLVMVPKIQQAKDALNEMGTVGKFAGRNMGRFATGVGLATVAIGVGLYAYGKASEAGREYQAQVEQLTGALEPVAKGQKNLNDALSEFIELQGKDLGEDQIAVMNALGVSLEDVEKAIIAGGDALDPFREAVSQLGVDLGGIDVGALDNDADGRNAAKELGEAIGFSADQVRGLIDATEDWDDAAQESSQRTIDLAVANGDFTQSAVDAAYAANELGDGSINYAAALDDLAPKQQANADLTGEQTQKMLENEEEVKALEERYRELGESFGSFTDGLDAWDTVIAANREWAESVAASTESAEDSWTDYYDGMSVSTAEWIAEMESQVTAQQEWERNLVEITMRGRADVAAELAKMGPDAAPLAQRFADMTNAEMERGAGLWLQTVNDGGDAAGKALDQKLQVMAAIMRSGGKATAQAIATELKISVGEVLAISSGYGVSLAAGLNPVLAGIGKQMIATGAAHRNDRVNRNKGGRLPAVGETDVKARDLQAEAFVLRPGTDKGTDVATDQSDSNDRELVYA